MKVERLFQLNMPEAKLRSTTDHEGHTHFTIEVSAEQHELARKLMETLGFSLTTGVREIAAFGTLEFSDDPELSANQLGVYDEVANDGEDDEEEGDSDPTESRLRNSPSVRDIDGSDRRFKVLVDTDQHKMANKLYDSLRGGDVDDRSDYGMFLYDFDRFMATYLSESDAEETDKFLKTGGPRNMAEQASTEEARERLPLAIMEVATLFAPLVAETARRKSKADKKEKSGRSAFLSKLMTAMTGSVGEGVIEAWQKGDSGALKKQLDSLAVKLVDSMPDGAEKDDNTSNADDPDADPTGETDGDTPPEDVDTDADKTPPGLKKGKKNKHDDVEDI